MRKLQACLWSVVMALTPLAAHGAPPPHSATVYTQIPSAPSNSPFQGGRTPVSPFEKGGLRGVVQGSWIQTRMGIHGGSHAAADLAPPAPLNLDPQLIQSSPTLQRWLKQVPNVLNDIKRDPSFRTRARLGYAYFPGRDRQSGWSIGLEDVFIQRTGLTLSADYQATLKGDRQAWGADLRYYVLPLGSSINLAPVVGYRYLSTSRYTTDGLNVGLRLLLVPSRTGAADISLTQSWVAPTTDQEIGLTTLSFGYALTRNLRLSTDLQKQNARQRKDSRVGISLEWMF